MRVVCQAPVGKCESSSFQGAAEPLQFRLSPARFDMQRLHHRHHSTPARNALFAQLVAGRVRPIMLSILMIPRLVSRQGLRAPRTLHLTKVHANGWHVFPSACLLSPTRQITFEFSQAISRRVTAVRPALLGADISTSPNAFPRCTPNCKATVRATSCIGFAREL